MSGPSTSALVVTYRTGPRLRDCLYALNGDPEIGELVIVDNGNLPAETAWLDTAVADWPKTAQLIRPGNIGFGRACNLAAKAARGAMLVFVNPDAMIRRGSVAAFRAALTDAPSPCLVGGKIFGLDGKEQRGARRKALTWATATGLRRWTEEGAPPPQGPVPVDAVSGAFFAMSKVDFLAVGGFDPSYFLHVEDLDLCRTVWDQGGRVLYQPRAGALHFGATSDAPPRTVARLKAESLRYYFKKWARSPVDRALNALLLPLLTRYVRSKAR
ncbi:MAG: glycosyltransferase family 2 protein [Pseudomonadota bacterium]